MGHSIRTHLLDTSKHLVMLLMLLTEVLAHLFFHFLPFRMPYGGNEPQVISMPILITSHSKLSKFIECLLWARYRSDGKCVGQVMWKTEESCLQEVCPQPWGKTPAVQTWFLSYQIMRYSLDAGLKYLPLALMYRNLCSIML